MKGGDRGPLAVSVPAFFIFFAAVLWIFPDIAFGDRTFVRRDILYYYHPIWKFGAESLRAGVFPLWNPWISFGTPFFANPQTCVSYPPAWMMALTPDFTRAFNLYVLFHLALAGTGAFLWLRDCGVSREGALAGGVAWMLGPYAMSTINLTIALASSAYFGFVLFAFRRALGETSGFRWRVAAAAALLLQYLAGDPNVSFATGLTLGAYALFASARAAVLRERDWIRPLTRLAQVGLAAGAFGAYQLVPFFEFLSHSVRFKMTSHESLLWNMQFNDLVSIAVPFFSDLSMYVMDYWDRQSWMETYYVGVTVLGLAGAAAFGDRRSIVGFHVLLAIWGITLALGSASLAYPALRALVPPLAWVRYPIRFYFLFGFAVACLAGFGVDAALRRPKAGRALLAFVAVAATGWVVVTVASGRIEPRLMRWTENHFGTITAPFYHADYLRDHAHVLFANARRSLLLAALLAAGLAAVSRARVSRPLAASFFVLLVFADVSSANVVEPRVRREILEQPSKNVSIAQGGEGVFRVFASIRAQRMVRGKELDRLIDGDKDKFSSNAMMSFRLYDALSYDSIYLSEVTEIQRRMLLVKDLAASRFLDWLNVRYLVSPRESLGDGFRPLNPIEPFRLYENERWLGRAYFVPRARRFADPAKLVDRVASDGYDPTAEICLEGAAAEGESEGSGTVGAIRYSPNRVEMDVETASGGWLFFSDSYYPGWVASVDGKSTPIERANYAFRAVRVPAGARLVTWRYEPLSLKAGIAVSALSIAVAGALCFAPLYSRIRL